MRLWPVATINALKKEVVGHTIKLVSTETSSGLFYTMKKMRVVHEPLMSAQVRTLA